MTVNWTDSALAQLDAIYAYIAGDSPYYAQRMVDRILRRSEQLAEHPLLGRAIPEAGFPQVREVVEVPIALCTTLRLTRSM